MMGMAEMPMSHQLFEMVAFAGHEIAAVSYTHLTLPTIYSV